jgi:aldehyde:ferredoxin oxidoreductase
LLDDYYALHGWDKRTGWQTREGLRSLGLEEVAEQLDRAGKLIE